MAGVLGSRPIMVPLANLGALAQRASGAQKWVRDALTPVVKTWRAHGGQAGRAALCLAMREKPGLGEWVERQ